MKMDGTGGGSENRKHQKPATYSQETCAELARNSQEEGFTGGLRACNARMFRHGPAPAVGTLLSRGMAVDNLWITMELIHMPRKRA